jgi:hypothetical protein
MIARNPLPSEPLGDFPSKALGPACAATSPTSSHRRGRQRRRASAGPSSICSASTPTGPIPGSTASAGRFEDRDIGGQRDDAAAVEQRQQGGARQSYRRNPDRPGRVPVREVGS